MTVLFAVGMLALVISMGFYLWLTIVAFKQGAGWGLAVFFLPFAFVIFAIKHWHAAKKPFLGYLGTSFAGLLLFFASGMAAAMQAGSEMEAEMLAAMEAAEVDEGFPEFDFETEGDAEPVAEDDGLDLSPDMRARISDTPSDDDLRTLPPLERPEPAFVSERAERLPSLPPDGRIKASRAGRYVGERMRVEGTNGLEMVGVLVGTKGDRLTFEKELGGGTATIEMLRGEIETLVVLRR